MSLELLLQWAAKCSLYIEILGDGSTEIQFCDEITDYRYIAGGRNLREALIGARRWAGRWHKELL